jgi:hypothetical protein
MLTDRAVGFMISNGVGAIGGTKRAYRSPGRDNGQMTAVVDR